AHARDLGRDGVLAATRLALEPLAYLGGDGLQRQPSVTDERLIDRQVAVDVAWIEGGVDDRLPRRTTELDAVAGGGEAAADAEEHVGLAHELVDRLRQRAAAGAQAQR